MKQIKLLKDWQSKKAGEIINISEKGAESAIKAKVAEYLEPEKENLSILTQQISPEIWEEFNKEVERIKSFDVSKLELTPEDNSVLDIFFQKFLDPKEEFPEGERHNTVEKNFAIFIIKNKIPLKEIQKGYEAKGFNLSSLKSQINGVLGGTYGQKPSVSVGELVNYCKRNRPDLVDLFKERPQEEHEYEKIDIKDLNDLKSIILKNFPSVWLEVRACLSIFATLSQKNLNGCPSLNLVGAPSGEKTTVLSFFYGHKVSYISDDFTPRSFVSHSANVKSEELESVDLLPRLKNKVLISPELAPLFEASKDKLIDNFAMLTRVLDGEGLNRDSGVHGQRGYSGDYKFGWLGASTPIKASVWKVMGKIGNRLFFLNMKDKNRTDNDYLDMFRSKAYEEKIKECRGAVKSFLDKHFNKYPIRELQWDAEQDIFILQEIIKYAKLLSKLRASLMIWKAEEKGQYEYNFPIIEEPPRAINSLYNLAKGHALIHDRTFLRSEDLEIVRAVAFSSMPHDRSEFLKILAKHEGRLTTSQIEKELGCSQDTALRTMKIFEVLGIVTQKDLGVGDYGSGRPMRFIEIKDEFKELLEHTQVLNSAINNKSQEKNPVSDAYDSVKVEDFIHD